MYSPLELFDYQIAVDREIHAQAEIKEYNTAFFTGHRGVGRSVVKPINKLIDMAIAQGVTEFFSGMAIGTDLLAAEILTDRNLPWKAITPCPYQCIKWSKPYQNAYWQLLRSADAEIRISENYTPTCMMERNAYMVKHSDLCLAVWDGRSNGGTYQTLKMALRAKKLIFAYNPQSNSFRTIDDHL
ncbi:MAG: DUF1273 family protein [Oscillatoriales cyanobacterium]|uniref:SLOG family protein n=1 Tax=unclassified Microcoleus TaxID=2642155 RepID=UPI001D1C780C|nr:MULTISPECIES: SLOG family protein [unclassified Microcoleus]TAF00853.1 MAG: DUF1273 family protein [Oscillatoriales cyanobacterium]MCC3459809.1 DUF1273 family protein [Microcoleus sp. PH2017_11_PCY_U_A]MCC3478243.1 DUF1273 family protein [Microcoleus sp. PH2017_12_PCY_D_A]TAF21388.1 MAG: DUF1273 family protein [Oscillatoriales cyanobacterium]TAF39685.1 MAG: DUF1273 family protein [Oscillatoriales cyanobacterium]